MVGCRELTRAVVREASFGARLERCVTAALGPPLGLSFVSRSSSDIRWITGVRRFLDEMEDV